MVKNCTGEAITGVTTYLSRVPTTYTNVDIDGVEKCDVKAFKSNNSSWDVE